MESLSVKPEKMNEKMSSEKSSSQSQQGVLKKVDQKVDQLTEEAPAVTFVTLALASLAFSAGLAVFTKRKDLANFVGLWAPTLMLIAVYRKLINVENAEGFGARQRQAS